MSFWGNESHTELYYLTTSNKATHTSASQESDRSTVWQIENVLTYDKTLGDHSFNVVLGQSAMKNTGWTLGASRRGLIDLSKPYIDFASGLAENGDRDGWGGPSDPHTLSSLFARLSYNYAERYMLQATVRRDGSSRFGTNNKYATFPSFSLGWNITNEPFMQKRPSWLTNMKLRASLGKERQREHRRLPLCGLHRHGQQLRAGTRRERGQRSEGQRPVEPRPEVGGVRADRHRPRPGLLQQRADVLGGLLQEEDQRHAHDHVDTFIRGRDQAHRQRRQDGELGSGVRTGLQVPRGRRCIQRARQRLIPDQQAH